MTTTQTSENLELGGGSIDRLVRRHRSALLKLAAEMVRCNGMPSPYIEDWNLAKTTPLRTMRQIRDAADKAEKQCKRWAVRLRAIIDADAKSPNDQGEGRRKGDSDDN